MKKLLFLLALSFVQMSFAQNSTSVYSKENAPLVIANGNKTYLYASALNVNNILTINVFKGEKATQLFGEKG